MTLPRLLLVLLLGGLGLHGCTSTQRAHGLFPCPSGYPDVPLKAETAYRGIVGVEIDTSLAPAEVVGTYHRTDGLNGTLLTLVGDGTVAGRPYGDVPSPFSRHRDDGTWSYGPGRVSLTSRARQESGACAETVPFDVVRVDGRLWLVETRMRPAVQRWFAWFRENGSRYEEGGEGLFVADYVFAVKQDEG